MYKIIISIMVFIIIFKDVLESNTKFESYHTLHIPFIIKFWIFTEILKNLLR
jgi:hypothetical protein